jgi:hypothetical protein
MASIDARNTVDYAIVNNTVYTKIHDTYDGRLQDVRQGFRRYFAINLVPLD